MTPVLAEDGRQGNSCMKHSSDFYHITNGNLSHFTGRNTLSILASNEEKVKDLDAKRSEFLLLVLTLPFIQASCISEARERKKRS